MDGAASTDATGGGRRFVARLHRARWALLAGTLLSLPTLGVGWFYDDLVHHAVLDDTVPGHDAGLLELYDFVHDPENVVRLRQAGRLPWFTDANLAIRFFRPLPSALRALEHAVFGAHAWPSHLLSILLFVAWLLVVFDLMEAIAKERAGLATLIFACAGAHALAVGWVAARYALLVGIFATLALRSYLRVYEGGRPWRSAAWLVCALLCGESGLAVLPFIGAHAALDRTALRRARLHAALPPCLTGALFVALYVSAGYGVRGTALYLSPVHSPWAYLRAAPERLAILLADLTTNIPSGVLYLTPPLRSHAWLVGVVGITIVAVATVRWVSPSHRRRLQWLWLGAGLSLIPAVAAIPEGRVVGVATLACASTFAAILQGAWSARPRRLRGNGGGAALAILITISVFVIGPLVRIGLTLGQSGIARWHQRIEVSSPLWRDPSATPRYTFILNSDDVLLWFYTPIAMPSSVRLTALGVIPGAAMVVPIDDHTLELRAETAEGFLESPLAGLVRERPLAPLERVDVDEFAVEVLQAAPSLRIRFMFDDPLSSPRYRFLEWDGSELTTVRLEVGVTHRIAYRTGPSSAPSP